MSTIFVRVTLLLLMSIAAFGQKLLIETDTQEGQILQQIDNETNDVKRLALLEQFAKLFPNHEAMTWVLGQLQTQYLNQKEWDKVLEAGTRMLGLDPFEVSAAHNCLRAAEQKKDVDLVRKWSDQTTFIAREVRKLPKPDDSDDQEDWKTKVEFAKQVEQYAEYSLYYAALNNKDSKVKNKLIEQLEQKNPTSEYLAQLRTSQTQVVRQVDVEEAVASAEAGFQKGDYNEELLLMAATHYMSRRVNPDRVINYSNKLVEVLATKPKPEDMSADEWDRKKRNMLGTANWMMGLLYSTQEKFALADRALRAALPNLKNGDMLAGALYHLGFVNYRMAEAGDRMKIHEAVRYTTDCAQINSAVQRQCSDNLKSMKAEYALP